MMMTFDKWTMDDFGQWPLVMKLAIISLLSFLCFGMTYVGFVQATFERYESLKRQEAQLKNTFELKQSRTANLEAYRKQMVVISNQLKRALQQLPTKNEMPSLLEEISKTGIACGLTFELFSPLPEVEHDFYIELPIKLVVNGTYEQFAVFLSRMAAMERLVTFHDFVIKEADVSKAPGKLIMEITAKIYRHNIQ
jgi:type IV pilus assembly protein PilO